MRPLPAAPDAGLALSALALLITLGGCGTTPASAPTTSLARTSAASSNGPALFAPGPGAMDALWPNDDGRYWEYHLVQTSQLASLPMYPPGVPAPPPPTVWEIAARLRSESIGKRPPLPDAFTVTGRYRLQFEGRLTLDSGAQGQNLVETLTQESGPRFARPAPGLRSAGSDVALPALLARVASARPDLAPALRKRFGRSAVNAGSSLYAPSLLLGGVWEKTAEHIGTYGYPSLDLGWIYLLADLQAGSTFALQLLPELVDDIWLHALVLPRRYETRPRAAPGAVQMLYLLDYGVGSRTSPMGENLGTYRSIEYGTVTYLPGVGPVAVFDRAEFPGTLDTATGLRHEWRATLTITGPQAEPLIGFR